MASVSRVRDKSEKKVKTVDLKNKLRITVIKSPVIINYATYEVPNAGVSLLYYYLALKVMSL